MAVLNDLMGLVAQDADGERSCLPDKPGEGEWRNENSDIIISDFVTQLTEGTVYPAKKASRPLGYLRHVSEEKFFTYLKCLHSRQLRDKDKNILISPAVFDPDRIPGSRRAKENILFLRHVWLDFENGDLKPSEFPELFPHVRMVVTNTYRHTPEKPRFRVIISTTQSMSLEAYDLIYHGIASKLEEAGYSVEGWKRTSRYAPSRKSGLDWGKRAPTSIFNAPCQAENPSESFFDIHAELGRMPGPLSTRIVRGAPRDSAETSWPRVQGHRIRSARSCHSKLAGSASSDALHAPDASPIGEGNGHAHGLQKLLGSP